MTTREREYKVGLAKSLRGDLGPAVLRRVDHAEISRDDLVRLGHGLADMCVGTGARYRDGEVSQHHAQE